MCRVHFWCCDLGTGLATATLVERMHRACSDVTTPSPALDMDPACAERSRAPMGAACCRHRQPQLLPQPCRRAVAHPPSSGSYSSGVDLSPGTCTAEVLWKPTALSHQGLPAAQQELTRPHAQSKRSAPVRPPHKQSFSRRLRCWSPTPHLLRQTFRLQPASAHRRSDQLSSAPSACSALSDNASPHLLGAMTSTLR